ncbi:MAG: flagellar biosynthesis anti-sigma factor FlgM [Pseudomonadota bacterium]
MNPVDNNSSLRTQRGDLDQSSREQGARRSESGAGVGTATSAAASTGDAESSGRGESVSFTQTASDLLSLETQLRELSGIDQARVDRIRSAIDNGSFEIDTDRIVENLLRSERELG